MINYADRMTTYMHRTKGDRIKDKNHLYIRILNKFHLENYGLNGPLENYLPPAPIAETPQPPTVNLPFHIPNLPSVTSLASRKKKQQEAKQATIR